MNQMWNIFKGKIHGCSATSWPSSAPGPSDCFVDDLKQNCTVAIFMYIGKEFWHTMALLGCRVRCMFRDVSICKFRWYY